MSLIYKQSYRDNLNDLNVFYEDNSLKSSEFFRISYLPEVLTMGKNMLKLSAHPFNLQPNTQIKIDIRDSNGNPIYFEIPDFLEDDKSRIISIWIYNNVGDLNTANGDATITLVGTAQRDKDGNPIPAKFKGKPNVRWKYKVNVDRDRDNITPIIFNPKSLPLIEPSESREVYSEIPTGSSPGSAQETLQTGSMVSYLYSGNTPVVTLNDGTTFNSEMLGFDFVISDFTEPAQPTTRYINTVNSSSHTSSLSYLISDTKAVLENEFTTQFQNREDLIHTYNSVTEASYSISYFSTGSNLPITSSLTSFATVKIDNLEPISGVVDRIKVFVKSLSFPDSEFELINDIRVDYTSSLLIKTPLNSKFQSEPKIIKLEYLSSNGDISRTNSISDIFVYQGDNGFNRYEYEGPVTFIRIPADSGSTTIDGPTIIISGSYGEFQVDNLLLTASIDGNILTFTKANQQQFDLVIDTGSFSNGYIENILYETGSLLFDGINGAFNDSINISELTQSTIVTASVSGDTITFTKGDSSQFTITVDTGSGGSSTDITDLNNFTGSYFLDSASFSGSISDLEDWSSSLSLDTSSLLVTASANLNEITFTKGDGSTFPIIVDTGSLENIISIDSGSVYFRVSQSAHGFSVGDPVSDSGSEYVLAANNSDGSLGCNGIVSYVFNANEFELLTKGIINHSSSLSDDQWAYLGSTPGSIVTTEPILNGIQLLYRHVDDGQIYVDVGEFFYRTGSTISGTQNVTEPLGGLIEDVITKTYELFTYTPYNGFIKYAGANLKSGSCDLTVLINDTICDGSPFTVSTGSLNKIQLSGSINFVEGDTLKMAISNPTGSAEDLNFLVTLNRSIL